eukprot:1139700-Heterocapsa_arctica.AAC.1
MEASIKGAFGEWMATGKNEHPPHYDDVWCICGNWHFGSALCCPCGLPSAKYRKGDWTCGNCRHSNFAKHNWCGKCNEKVSEGTHAF